MTASNLSDANVVTGRGVAWSNVDNPKTYAQTAAIADIEVNKKTGKITVKHIYQASAPASRSIPAGSRTRSSAGSRRSSAACSSSSTATAKTNVTSTDFVTYPILRFKDAPR